MTKKPPVIRYLFRALAALLAAAVLYLAVILAEPEKKDTQNVSSSPLTDAVGDLTASDTAGLDALYTAFGAPALRLRSGKATLQSAQCRDLSYGTGYARLLQVTYSYESGAVSLISIRPAGAENLLTPQNMTLSTDLSQALAGLDAVLFTGTNGARRLYAKGEDAAYLLYGEGLTEEAFQTFSSYITLTAQEDTP